MANNSQPPGPQPLWPPIGGSTGPPQNFGGPPLSMQFQSVFPPQQAHSFNMAASQHFRPIGQGNVGLPSAQNQQLQFPQILQQLPLRSGQPSFGPPSSQAVPSPYVHPLTSIPAQPQQNTLPLSNHMPGIGGMGTTLSSSYTFAPSSYGNPQNNINASSQYQLMHASITLPSGQTSVSSGIQTMPVPPPHTSQHPTVTAPTVLATNMQPRATIRSSTDWIEHTSADGRRYYYNRKTRQSSWEKPLELMTTIERADASTNWKEFTSPDGRKYYYNKVTKQSKWTMPNELKLAREQVVRGDSQVLQPDIPATSQVPDSVTVSSVETPSISSSAKSEASSPGPVVPVTAVVTPLPVVASGLPSIPILPSSISTNDVGDQSPVVTVTYLPTSISDNADATAALVTSTPTKSILEGFSPHEAVESVNGDSAQDLEQAKKGITVTGKVNVVPLEDKAVEAEPLIYAIKQEGKDVFKALLESANVEFDCSWEQAMRVIINDKRYGALRTLGERKQAFNEYLGQRKKQEAEERRIKQRKTREDFTKMLEETDAITSIAKWSKAITIFEDDERFKAVERVREREDLFESYIAELKKREKAKAHEEHKRNLREYKQFLQSCDFIKANSQWRKVQDRLEQDERCSCLEKIDRLEIFQEYINDLEKEEEEQMKIQKEQLRRTERNNRDEFRKLMEEHVVAGILTAKTHWREYHEKVKDLPAYVAASSNTSGATPKVLFEDVAEELEKQYHDDKARIKDAIKLKKITMTSTWTLEDLNLAVVEEMSSSSASNINLKLVFDELLERVKEKEEKEAKKLQSLADNFSQLLYSIKEINSTSTWDDCRPLFEDIQEYKSIEEESFKRKIFEEYITHLQEKAKEKERKRMEEKARKEKERGDRERRKEKEREEEREHGRDIGEDRSTKVESESGSIDAKEGRKREREKEKDRKHRKRRHNEGDEVSSEREEKEDPKKSHRHRSEGKKSRKHVIANESDSESRHRRHKREHRRGSRRSEAYDHMEDGELGEDGEIR